MKVIVCTGDSHTVGQGADSVRSKYKYKDPGSVYNTSGKGISRGGDLDSPSYVNLLRRFVAEHTSSQYAITDGWAMRAQTGYPLVNKAVKLEGKLQLPKGWEMHTLCLMETTTPAKLGIFVDGEPVRKEVLHTPLPRYNDYSFRNISIRCEKDQQVTLLPLEGDVYISHVQHDKGQYAVINSGVGSCTTKRYLEECFPYCVEEFQPDIIIAEAHTINDWINYESAAIHSQMLNALLDRYIATGAKLVYSTVAPIRGSQLSKRLGNDYGAFIAQSMTVADREDLLFADSHAAFLKELEPIPLEEQFESLYVDNLHVNGRGHRIYAETIFEKLKELL